MFVCNNRCNRWLFVSVCLFDTDYPHLFCEWRKMITFCICLCVCHILSSLSPLPSRWGFRSVLPMIGGVSESWKMSTFCISLSVDDIMFTFTCKWWQMITFSSVCLFITISPHFDTFHFTNMRFEMCSMIVYHANDWQCISVWWWWWQVRGSGEGIRQ